MIFRLLLVDQLSQVAHRHERLARLGVGIHWKAFKCLLCIVFTLDFLEPILLFACFKELFGQLCLCLSQLLLFLKPVINLRFVAPRCGQRAYRTVSALELLLAQLWAGQRSRSTSNIYLFLARAHSILANQTLLSRSWRLSRMLWFNQCFLLGKYF